MTRKYLFAFLFSIFVTSAALAQEGQQTEPGNVTQVSPSAGMPTPQPDTDPNALVGDPVPPEDPSVAKAKAQYNLFNPTPDEDMRQFSTDRPGKTHSALTVDAGHFQVESDFFNYTYDHYSTNGQTTRIDSVATPIVKMGITNNIDLEAAFDFYNSTHVTARGTSAGSTSGNTPGGSGSTIQNSAAGSSGPAPGSTQVGKGFGDVQLGSKINLLGNDGGADWFGLLPFVKIPTAAANVGNGEVEYTINAPYTHQFDSLWSITVEEAFGWLRDTDNASHHADYTFLVNVDRPIIDKNLTASLEVAAEYAERNVPPRYTLDPAIQYLVTPAFQLDMGIYLGLNKAAPDYNPYVGVSFRY